MYVCSYVVCRVHVCGGVNVSGGAYVVCVNMWGGCSVHLGVAGTCV